MNNKTLKYISISGFFLFLIACSAKKDKFVNRNFHAVTTEYNVLYNGNLALENGVAELVKTYQDNFWEVLPVERMSSVEKGMLPGKQKNADFERAEEKAVKAIQKHSMNIGGTERNPQMDEAYLLLAKARYYDNRFIPSLEALNYILYKYPQSDKIYHAKVWREKVNIRIENNEIAIQNLKKLLTNNLIEGQDLADANAMLSQAYMNVGANDSAISTLKIAKENTKKNEEKARYAFILGQLYESFEYSDSAFVAYQEIIDMKRKAPRRYTIQAHAKQASQFDYANGDTLVFLEKFDKLIKDRENRPYLDVLYFQKGLFYDKLGKQELAKQNYNKSIRSFSEDNYLIASDYRNTAEIHFKSAEYKTAGMYYDSTMMRMDDRSREFRRIKKKRDNLEDVIRYEDIAQQNDSILAVVAMSQPDRVAFYERYIADLKVEDERKAKAAAELAEKEANKLLNASSNPGMPTSNAIAGKGMLPPSSLDPSQSTFYFYNPVTVSYGKNEFQKRWGKKQLEENWRMAKSSNTDNIDLNTDVVVENDSVATPDLDPRYSVDFYLSQIPTDEKVIDTLAIDRNFAYYQLGLIYKEKFKEYELAASRLETLLKNNPEERLVLPAKYNLYKIYEMIDPAKAQYYKNDIISNYPESRYAQILLNPSSGLSDNDNPEVVYKALYRLYEENHLREAYEEVNARIDQYLGDEALPKFEMLKASITGRLEGVEAYKKALTYVSLSYPNNEEGKTAEQILQRDVPKLEVLNFNPNEGSSYKIVFTKNVTANENKDELVKKLELYLKDRHSDDLKMSFDIYTMQEDFIVLHGFATKEVAAATVSLLNEYKDYKVKDKAYIISTEDYKVVQIKKQFEEWLKLNN
ncbi:gliding motility protein [Flavobacterium chuncheonense]|uniref:Gliding motility protein n=1 Tax=Flavobacterium chuncheonense TaxID=2026653 RepID=A0ABW5YMZ8_9FLAO